MSTTHELPSSREFSNWTNDMPFLLPRLHDQLIKCSNSKAAPSTHGAALLFFAVPGMPAALRIPLRYQVCGLLTLWETWHVGLQLRLPEL
jgi:hypothetical protein